MTIPFRGDREERGFDTTRTINAADSIAYRRARRRGRRIALLGVALVAYGLIGMVIFAFVATAINRPLERVRELSESVELQRTALVSSMQEAETTLRSMARAVGNMDTSLGDAKIATDRSAGIATGVATSMFQLRDQMNVEIPLLGRPLAGLSAGFDTTGQQLSQLSTDLATIGTSLDVNRDDVVATSGSLVGLADSVEKLTDTVREGPTVEITAEAIDSFRLAIFAIAGWVVLFAVGCVLVGAYLVFAGSREGRDIRESLARAA
jgi:hypothetical protein